MKIPKWQHELARYYKRGKLVSYFLNNPAKTCLYGLKIPENIEIGHFFQSITFFHLSSNPHTSCLSVFKKHLFEYRNNLKHLKGRQHKIINVLLKLVGKVILRILLIDLCNSLRKSNILQLKTKNNKIIVRTKHANKTSQVPVKNLSDYGIDASSLKYGLNYSFIDKNKFIKRDLAVEFESLVTSVDELVTQEQKEEFHEFLRQSTDLLSQNVYHIKDNTFKETHKIRNNNNVVILPGDKDSSAIMNRSDYSKKVESMLQQGISEGKYVRTEDNILKELKSFQSFIYRHFKKSKFYNDMMPSSHQPARFFTSAKTHKFENVDDINIKELKPRPVIDQTGTCYYKTGKVIAQYLKPLTKNEFVINDTQDFPLMLNRVEISEDEDVSYDVESRFTNTSETIDFICDEIYIHKKLQPICERSIFKEKDTL